MEGGARQETGTPVCRLIPVKADAGLGWSSGSRERGGGGFEIRSQDHRTLCLFESGRYGSNLWCDRPSWIFLRVAVIPRTSFYWLYDLGQMT